MSVLDRVREKYKTPDLATCKTSRSPSAGFAGSPHEHFASAGAPRSAEDDSRRAAILAARDAAGLEDWRAALRSGRLHLCANCTQFAFGPDPREAGYCARYDTQTYPFVTMLRCSGFRACAPEFAVAPEYLPQVPDSTARITAGS